MVIAKGDGREIGFQDDGCFSRFLKRERDNSQTFITFLNLTLTVNLTSIMECYKCLIVYSFSF